MTERRHVHVITPGDHYSPRTGSAIPTVVHGLCDATPEHRRPAVVVARGTYPDRYASAEILEYDRARALLPVPAGLARYLDGGLGALGLPRVASRHDLAATVHGQADWEPAVVLAHNAPQLVPVVDARRHVPVLYAHNHLLRTYRSWEARRVLDRVGAIICVSNALAGQTAAHLPRYLRERLRVVHNGVDFAAFHPDRARVRSGQLRVGFVGRMIPDKGADVLVDALVRLDRPDIHLTLVGSSGFSATDSLTPYEREIRTKAGALGDRVEILPFMPRAEVVRLLQSVDVVVVPSRWPEPFALTVLEGMAAGAAVVASEIGGIPETVRDVGLLVPPDDTGALAEALEALADDVDLLERTAAGCVAYARAHDWGRSALSLQSALHSALGERG